MQTWSKTNKCGVYSSRQIHAAKSASDITCNYFTYLQTVTCDHTHVVGRVVKQCFFADVFGEQI